MKNKKKKPMHQKSTPNLALKKGALACALYAATCMAQAQVAPDAGQTLQQLQPRLEPPRESLPLTLPVPPAQTSVPPGGVQIKLSAVRFAGNTVFDEATLLAALEPTGGTLVGQRLDLAGLRAMVDQVSEFYRLAGYPFARAFLAPQDMAGGVLQIDVLEGRYGQVQPLADAATAKTTPSDAYVAQAQAFLGQLHPGQVIQSPPLERAMLILGDQPGIQVLPLIKPGQEVGTADLDVGIVRTPLVSGDVSMDNYGSRYSGYNRALANLSLNSPFMLGDQVNLRSLYSDADLWLGSVGYSLPLGGSGFRGNVSYAKTSYSLGKEFASMQANGTAQVRSLGVTYQIVRSQQTNLNLSAAYQDKQLNDRKDALFVNESKSSSSMPLVLQFDHRDSLGMGGISYGTLGWTPGHLALDAGLTSSDSRNTRGRFDKVNLDVVRLQSLSSRLSLYGRVNGQWAKKNLDSSESFFLGGATAVRAYPSGEASGDAGVLAQLEVRMNLNQWSPYVFYDAGALKVEAKPASGATNNTRQLGGGGVGLRVSQGPWNADAVLAWRSQGGVATADTSSDSKPRVWVTAGYRF